MGWQGNVSSVPGPRPRAPRIVAFSMTRFMIRQPDEPVNSYSGKGFDAPLVKGVASCHCDFQFP